MSEHLLPHQCSSCTWRAEDATRREVKEGETQLLLRSRLCWIPVSASRGQGSTCSELGLCVIWPVAPVRASPATISSSGDGARVREGEKAAMLCKPVPMAAEPVGGHVAMLQVSEWLFTRGRSQPLPDPPHRGKKGFAGGFRGAKAGIQSHPRCPGGGWGVCLSVFNQQLCRSEARQKAELGPSTGLKEARSTEN